MHRDDQLFLDDTSSHMHEEQGELLAKINRLTIPDARVQHRVWGISDGVRADVVLPEAERGTVASKAGDLRHPANILTSMRHLVLESKARAVGRVCLQRASH